MAGSKIFISYSHDDAEELEDVQRFLKPLEERGLIDAWDDTRLQAGDDWAAAIDDALAEASVAVLLITQNFVNSEFITDSEVPRILAAQDRSGLEVIPVFLRPATVDVEYAVGDSEKRVELTTFQGFGTPDKVLMELGKSAREKVYVRLAGRLRKLSRGAPSSPSVEPAAPESAPEEPEKKKPDKKEPDKKEPEKEGSESSPAADPSLVELRFLVFEQRGKDKVSLSTDGQEEATSTLDVDLGESSRLSQVIAKIEGSPQRDDLMDVGSQLWAGLISGAVEQRFEEIFAAAEGGDAMLHVRLDLDSPRLARLPWETFYDERWSSFLGEDSRYCVIRDPGEVKVPALPGRQAGALSVLAVIPRASEVADREWSGLQHAVGRLGSAIRLERLEPPVTPDRLKEELAGESWDVVHFAGFGETEDGDRARILLDGAGGGEGWVEAEAFGEIFRGAGVRLAVLACVQGRSPSPRRSSSALGPALLSAGVPAVIAARYELPGEVAGHLGHGFYDELITGEERGRIDRAMVAARRAVFLSHNATNVRGFVSPVLYLAPGGHRLSGLPAPKAEARPAAPAATPAVEGATASAWLAENRWHKRLVKLVRKERCVPIIGPGLSGAGTEAGAAAALGRRQLIGALAEESDYPDPRELELWNVGGDWLVDQVLQRVCQHFYSVMNRTDLKEVLLEIIGRSEPSPALLQLARWRAPGFICTTIDGLMAEALKREDRPSRMVNYIDREGHSDDRLPLLVHLRGTPKEEDSLILAEEDHDLLWQRLQNLNNQIVQLVNSPGRAILLLGVSPQDTLVRRFLQAVHPEGLTKKEGNVFFVCAEPSPVDEAYWSRYETEWLSEDPAQVIAMITALLEGEAES